MRPTADTTTRQIKILSVLVRKYIETGEPVSSLWLTGEGGFQMSSATVRSVLAGLEEAGYLRQPHTSSGRVPTDLAYRCYVNKLLEGRRRPPRPSRQMAERLSQSTTLDEILASVSHELFRMSHYVGFAFTSSTEENRFQQIQFVPLGAGKVLVVVVATDGQISNKAIDMGEPVDVMELARAAQYLNAEYSGHPLSTVRAMIAKDLQEERLLYDALLLRALELASSTFQDIRSQNPVHIQGTSSLLEESAEHDDELPRACLRAVLEIIEEKSRLVRLLGEYIEGPGLTVVIGSEHRTPDLQHLSVVTATYQEGHGVGTVGILGPRRMRYSRAIAAVDDVAEALARVFPRATD